MILGAFISDVLDMLNVSSDDSRFHEELIYNTARDINNEYIRQETDKGKLVNEGQTLFHVKLLATDLSMLPGIGSGVVVHRSEIPIPAVLDNKTSGKLFNAVYTALGVVLYPTEMMHYLNSFRRPHVRRIPKYYIGGDGHMYGVNLDTMAPQIDVNVDALFEDPISIERLNNKDSNCLSILDMDFFIPGFLVNRVKLSTRDSLAARYQLPNDQRNNSKEDIDIT